MRSAFYLDNGVRVVFETTTDVISIYFCDEDWKPTKHFSTMDLIGSEEEYHRNIRYAHQAARFVEAHSTLY